MSAEQTRYTIDKQANSNHKCLLFARESLLTCARAPHPRVDLQAPADDTWEAMIGLFTRAVFALSGANAISLGTV